MKIKTKFFFWLVAIALSQAAMADTWFGGGRAGDPLSEAHQAYLDGNYLQMGLKIKEALQAPTADDMVRKNAMELMGQAYAAADGRLPADWKLPPEVPYLNFFVRRTHRSDGDCFGIKISGRTIKRGMIQQLQLIQAPNRVLLDKEQKVGSWEDQAEHAGDEFELHNLEMSQPVAEGLYYLNLELTNGTKVQGWFPLSDLLSSATPKVRIPTPGQVFTTGNPVLRWDEFKSPESKKFEWNAVWLAAWSHEDKDAWERYVDDPAGLDEIKVGVKGKGPETLSPDRYSFIIAYREMKRFGDLRLGRQSVTSVPFVVK